LGAASAVVALGVAGGVVFALRRPKGDDAEETPDVTAPAAAVASLDAYGAAPDSTETFAAVAWPPAPAESDDELERLALSLADAAPAGSDDDPDDDPTPPRGPQGPGPGDTASFMAILDAVPAPSQAAAEPAAPAAPDADAVDALTLPFSPVDAPTDVKAFVETAKVLANGSGTVHRVVAPAPELKPDLDLSGLDAFGTSCNAVVDSPLTAESEDWLQLALRELATPTPVAPSSELSTDDYVALTSTKRDLAAPSRTSQLQTTAYVAPVIGPSTVSADEARRHQDMLREATTPEARALADRDEQFRAGRTAASAPIDPALKGADLAAAMARNTYAAFAPHFARAMNPAPAPAPVQPVYQAAPAAAEQPPAASAQPARQRVAASNLPSIDIEGLASAASHADPCMTTMLSPAYIDYMVREEFEHRHDTTAQRNVALGRMRLVQGGASQQQAAGFVPAAAEHRRRNWA
jgi:hypothetical protein